MAELVPSFGIVSPENVNRACQSRNLVAFSSHIDRLPSLFRKAAIFPMNFGNARTWPLVNCPPSCADSVSVSAMIRLTRLNNSSVTINSDLIKFVEESPDTVVTLLNGEKILVRECVDQIVTRVIEFRRELLSATVTWGGVRAEALPATCILHAHKESEG